MDTAIKMDTTEMLKVEETKLKPMKCEMNYLSKSDGSAILAQGNTVVLVGVNGPLDIKMQSQSIEKATLEVLFLSKGGKPSVGDRYKESMIRQTCETAILAGLHPRSGITITIQELEDCGGLMACCINASCLALLNSGLPMKYVFAGVMCCIDESGNVLLDPPRESLEKAQATMTFVFDSQDRGLITCQTGGICSEHAYKEALEICRAASNVVFDFYKEIVVKYSKII